MATYACSDLHGRLDLLKQIQSFLKPEDKVYYLGDAGDRGPEPWKTIKEIAADNRFIYIKGNHEDMLVKAMEDYIKYEHIGQAFALLAQNGGEETFLQWNQEEQKTGWYSYLRKLPTYFIYTNPQGCKIYLSHAGFNPMQDDAIPNDDDLLWDREHFLVREPKFNSNELVVHGHTPIPTLFARTHWDNEKFQWMGEAYWYANDHKVDLDCGSVVTGRTVLLDLDTFDEQIFIVEKESD